MTYFYFRRVEQGYPGLSLWFLVMQSESSGREFDLKVQLPVSQAPEERNRMPTEGDLGDIGCGEGKRQSTSTSRPRGEDKPRDEPSAEKTCVIQPWGELKCRG